MPKRGWITSLQDITAERKEGAYQASGGSLSAVYDTYRTGKEYPGTATPYWGEQDISGYWQQKGIKDGLYLRNK
jgi:hypothetical protein